MRRSLSALLGGCLLFLLACSGASESESPTTSTEQAALTAIGEDVTKKECPWTSAEDSSCAPGTSEAACGNGTGKCGISGSLGCTCIKTVVAEPLPTTPVGASAVIGTPEDVTTKQCPWASAEDPSCAPGTSEAACNNGTGKCRVSGSSGCTCVSNTVVQPLPTTPVVAP
jgi:hypothetical protein